MLAARLLSQPSSTAPANANNTHAAGAASQPSAAPDAAAATARIGAECALRAMCERFQGGLFLQLPFLWLQMSAALGAAAGDDGSPRGDPQGLINAIQVGWRHG